jgi:hypothetical protein
VRRAAARSQCANNLKQITLGLHNYQSVHNTLPTGTIANDGLPCERRLSWCVVILPFVEEDPLFRRFDRKAAWDAAANEAPAKTPLHVFQCPDWSREASPDPAYLTAYVGVAGVGADAASLPADSPRAGLFGYDRATNLAKVKDGTSNTLLILETALDNGPWSLGGPATVRGLDPGERPYLGTGRPFGGTHFAENTLLGRGKSVGCNAAMADGSVHFLAETMAPELLEGLATAAGGEDIPRDW